MILEGILESAIMTTIDDVINGSQYMIKVRFPVCLATARSLNLKAL